MNKNTVTKKVFLLLAIVALWVIGLYESVFLINHYDSTSIRLQKDTITSQQIRVVLDREERENPEMRTGITLWQRGKEETLMNPILDFKQKVRKMEVWGNMEKSYPMDLAYGNYCHPEDTKGCVIDQKTAFTLFGTEKAVGSMIMNGEKNYYIRGIVRTREPLFFVQGEPKEEGFQNLELVFSKSGDEKNQAEQFLFQNNISSDYEIIEGSFYANSVKFFLEIPLLFLLIVLGVRCVRQFFSQCKIWKKARFSIKASCFWKGILWMVGFCLITLFGFLIKDFFPLPEQLIPTKWSDFDFWAKLGKDYFEGLEKILYMTPQAKDILLYNGVKRSLLCMVASLIGVFIFLKNKKIKNL